MPIDEIMLIRRTIAGEQEATRILVELLAPVIERAVAGAGFSGADIDDLSQDVWRQLWRGNCRALQNWSGEGSLSAYVSCIARNKAMDRYRALRRRRETALAEDHLLTFVFDDRWDASDELWNLLDLALTRLEDRDARIIRLRYIEGCTYAEIADILECNANSVGQTLRRAVERLAVVVRQLGLRAA